MVDHYLTLLEIKLSIYRDKVFDPVTYHEDLKYPMVAYQRFLAGKLKFSRRSGSASDLNCCTKSFTVLSATIPANSPTKLKLFSERQSEAAIKDQSLRYNNAVKQERVYFLTSNLHCFNSFALPMKSHYLVNFEDKHVNYSWHPRVGITRSSAIVASFSFISVHLFAGCPVLLICAQCLII